MSTPDTEHPSAACCHYCGEPINNLAGDPGLWPLTFCHPAEPGVPKQHHVKCLTARLAAAEANEKRIHELEQRIESMKHSFSNDVVEGYQSKVQALNAEVNRLNAGWEQADGLALKNGLERQAALATVAEMRSCLQSVYDEHTATVQEVKETGHSEGCMLRPSLCLAVLSALSTDAGKGWVSPDQLDEIRQNVDKTLERELKGCLPPEDITGILHAIQRLQPPGSPPPTDVVGTVEWITQEVQQELMALRLKAADRDEWQQVAIKVQAELAKSVRAVPCVCCGTPILPKLGRTQVEAMVAHFDYCPQSVSKLRAELERAKEDRNRAGMEERRKILPLLGELADALRQEREAVAAFLAHRVHLDQSWIDHFVNAGIVTFDGLGCVKAVPVSRPVTKVMLWPERDGSCYLEFSDTFNLGQRMYRVASEGKGMPPFGAWEPSVSECLLAWWYETERAVVDKAMDPVLPSHGSPTN